jgi:hypothetical protein
VSAGVGYTEYATRLAVRLVPNSSLAPSNMIPDSSNRSAPGARTSIYQRDTYRFLTVPLRASYTWTTGTRWRVGLLGGADAAIYLGGTSTEGSPCACQTQTWGASGSPYRKVSLGLSVGAEVRYRMGERWEVLAQPVGTYLLMPLARPGINYPARYLFGGSALLGVSYDLP